MISVTFYAFTKRINSTLIPTASTQSTIIDCSFKNDTSMRRPTLLVRSATMQSWNYCLISEYSTKRYYFIENMISTGNNLWEVVLECDTLATYRDNINNVTAYVERSSSMYNVDIADTEVTFTNEFIHSRTRVGLTILDKSEGTYIVTVVGNGAFNGSGFTIAYAMAINEMARLVSKLVTDQSLWEEIKQWANSPYDAIVSCVWVPFQLSAVSGSSAKIYLGNYDTGISAKCVSQMTTDTKFHFAIPHIYNDFRDSVPYTTYSLYLPCFGMVQINAGDLYKTTSLGINYFVDFVTGDIAYEIINDDTEAILNTVSVQTACNMPIAQVASPVGSLLSSVGTAIPSALIGNIAGVVASVGQMAIMANSREPQYSGNMGGRAGAKIDDWISLHAFSKKTLREPSSLTATIGRPCEQIVQLATLTGYCKCKDASVAHSGTSEELQKVNDFLNGGIYLE